MLPESIEKEKKIGRLQREISVTRIGPARNWPMAPIPVSILTATTPNSLVKWWNGA